MRKKKKMTMMMIVFPKDLLKDPLELDHLLRSKMMKKMMMNLKTKAMFSVKTLVVGVIFQ